MGRDRLVRGAGSNAGSRSTGGKYSERASTMKGGRSKVNSNYRM